MADAWADLQAIKSKRDNRRKRLEERKKERQEVLLTGLSPSKSQNNSQISSIILGTPLNRSFESDLNLSQGSSQSSSQTASQSISSSAAGVGDLKRKRTEISDTSLDISQSSLNPSQDLGSSSQPAEDFEQHLNILEEFVLKTICESILHLPLDSRSLESTINKSFEGQQIRFHHDQITNLLEKFAVQQLISIEEKVSSTGTSFEIISAEHNKLQAMVVALTGSELCLTSSSSSRKKKGPSGQVEDSDESGEVFSPDEKRAKDNDVLSLLSLASTREKENKRIGEEILELLSRPTAKERTLAERFRSQGGGSVVQEFCPHGTKSDCRKVATNSRACTRVHFRKIIQSHTDESLGDCSFLNTCFHMESCKYVHYEVDAGAGQTAPLSQAVSSQSSAVSTGNNRGVLENSELSQQSICSDSELSISQAGSTGKTVLHPAQWIHCDLRYFDMTILGKFSVIMADPPWNIHMELPYGTLSDDEMRMLNIPALQDEGLIFLWVTGRAMELGRDCLQFWGYERVDELIWVKTNQLQRIIRTGRTGHWLNHGKEHCLVGMKGNPPINQGLDCDIIVAEVRATSHKPDEIYGIIERLSPGTRKIELFGRRHNIQPNWVTLGNQLDGVKLVDEELKSRFFERYPEGNCMLKPAGK